MASDTEHLKIGFVLDSGLDKPDGVQQYVRALGDWLTAHGHQVRYLVGTTKRQDIPGLYSLGRSMPVRFNGNNGSIPLWASRRTIRQVLKKERFDVLHIQVPHHPLLAQRIILAADKRTAVIGTFHIAPYNRLVTFGNTLLGWWLKPSLKRFDDMVSVSSTAKAFAKETFGINTDVLPNVIDYQRFHQAAPLTDLSRDEVHILFLGRLVPRKGCQLLLEAIRLLRDSGQALPKFDVSICGGGPLESQLRAFIKKYKLENTVKLVGFVSEDEKLRHYKSANIAVFPSSGGESFGIVLVEAMAAGAMVLAGDNPGYRSVMTPQPELLFDPHDAQSLAAKLAHYLSDQKARQAMQAWCTDYAQQFDVNVVGQQLLTRYRKALRKRRQL